MAAANFNASRCADLNELLVALGAGLLAVAIQQLAQQADTFLQLLDGIQSLGHLLYALLVLKRERVIKRVTMESIYSVM